MNKNLLKLSVVLLSVGLIFSGCSKDDEEVSQAFTYKGKTYDLDKGEMTAYGSITEGVYNIDLTLYSNEAMSETGIGNAVYFEMFTDSNTDFANGTYTFNSSSEANFTFDIGRLFMNYNFNDETGSYVNISEGTVSIQKSESTYTVTISCKDSEGNKIEGSYKGTLEYGSWKK